MDTLRALLLALIQGITEFLPISSSAHLILPSQLLGWPDQGLAFDVAVHLGTLLAVLVYFRADLRDMFMGLLEGLRARRLNPPLLLALWVGIGTLPVIVAGWLLKDLVAGGLRHTGVIAGTTIAFGLLLGWADWRHQRSAAAARSEYELRPRDVLVIGLMQCLALVPGTSRSGITMTAGLMMGLTRAGAARFSFLLSIPTILGAAVLSLADLLADPQPVAWGRLALACATAGAAAFACIRVFIALLERTGFLPYVIYRLLLGGLLVWLLL